MTRSKLIQTIGIVFALIGAALWIQVVTAQNTARYRDFEFGGSVSSISALAGVPATDARTLHQRPAVLQELSWRRPYAPKSGTAVVDPVQTLMFSFYNDQLFRIVVDYDRDRTEGMKDADMVDALSTVYGAASLASKNAVGANGQREDEFGIAVARWVQPNQSIVLYRANYMVAFKLIVTAIDLDARARTAAAEAVRIDEREAPQREIARLKQEADLARAVQDKARDANKPAFRP